MERVFSPRGIGLPVWRCISFCSHDLWYRECCAVAYLLPYGDENEFEGETRAIVQFFRGLERGWKGVKFRRFCKRSRHEGREPK